MKDVHVVDVEKSFPQLMYILMWSRNHLGEMRDQFPQQRLEMEAIVTRLPEPLDVWNSVKQAVGSFGGQHHRSGGGLRATAKRILYMMFLCAIVVLCSRATSRFLGRSAFLGCTQLHEMFPRRCSSVTVTPAMR